MSFFAESEKRLLLSLARESLDLAVKGGEHPTEIPGDNVLQISGGAFVTLRARRRLRGCVGRLPSAAVPIPLGEVIRSCARSAALEDPRFTPVVPSELPEIEIELSVLSPLFDVAPEEIVAGRHGLSVSRGPFRGVLLPQVATEFRWNAARFLEETCVKAGLERDAWRQADTRVQAFTAEVFSESEFRREKTAGPGSESGPGKSYSSST
ncbi:MAG TPA: AmmeMemoRadiSam system protein A [Verrucomicrobiae bacterium]|nr:AmmeMemoRadiSam system protein A [Verrucomicrobiae bacterium]